MLTRLRLKNFKAWQDSGDLRLAPLTVLFGTNSAGKTSIPQLLLLLKQTAESSDRQRALQVGDSRKLVDVGTYEDVVHGHNVSQPLEFMLRWSLEPDLVITDSISLTEFTGDEMEFTARLVADTRRQPRTASFRYDLRKNRKGVVDLTVAEKKTEQASGAKRANFKLMSSNYDLVRHPGRAWDLPQPLRFYGFPDEVAAYYQNATVAADFVFELERMLKSIFHVGPLREYPKRLYLWSGEVPDHVGARGDRAIEAILASGDRMFNVKRGTKKKTLPALVAERLREMGLIDDFEVKPIGLNRKEYEVLVRTGPNLPNVKLTDVGFGVSQVLPVIVECFYVPRRSIVIFEQPEIHLHPRVQADLADLFADAIRAREDRQDRNCQFIIESHSEHFLRRLQRRIAEGDIAKEDTALYFVRTKGSAAHIEELAVDDYGNIKNWPDGFFGDEMADLVARSEAQAKRMSKDNAK